MEFVLTRNRFCNLCMLQLSTIKLVFKPVFLKQFHFLEPFDIFMTLLKYGEKASFAKKVTSRDAKEDVDKVFCNPHVTSTQNV